MTEETKRTIFFRPQVNPFVLLFVERSGSTYLTTLLNSHPDVYAQGEKFDALKQQGKGAREQLEWAEEVLTPPLVGRNKARGFKTKTMDILDPDGFAELMRRRQCKIIQLQRRNLVKAVVSTVNAKRLWEQSGTWNLLNEKNRLSEFTVTPDVFDELLQQRIQWDDELESYVQSLHLPTLKLNYEELLTDEAGFISRIYSFLALKPKPAHGITLKNTKDDLRHVLLNFNDLRVKYAGTPYQAMFDEILLPDA